MTLDVVVTGIGAWSADHRGWPALRDAVRVPDAPRPDASPSARPVAMSLPPAERRRVPDGVAVALEVAREALAAAADGSTSGDAARVDSGSLASVFASGHGDLAIVDYLCRTLADDPLALSPTRFHHSVHNAAAGYWSIATPSVGASISIAAGDASFPMGLLEAATQVVVDGRPVLLVVFDTPGVGLLARAAPNTALFGAALLLAPAAAATRSPRLSIAMIDRAVDRAVDPAVDHSRVATPALRALAASSPAARALPLLEALARSTDAALAFALGPGATLSVDVRPARGDAPGVA